RRRRITDGREEQRLVDQAQHQVKDVGRRDGLCSGGRQGASGRREPAACLARALLGSLDRVRLTTGASHGLRGLQGGTSDEHRQSIEEGLFSSGEQVVAPVEGGAQRLLTRERDAAASGQEVESVVEPRRELLYGESAQSRRRQLQGQRDAVQ